LRSIARLNDLFLALLLRLDFNLSRCHHWIDLTKISCVCLAAVRQSCPHRKFLCIYRLTSSLVDHKLSKLLPLLLVLNDKPLKELLLHPQILGLKPVGLELACLFTAKHGLCGSTLAPLILLAGWFVGLVTVAVQLLSEFGGEEKV
jgi:hypothetical protein